MLMVYFEDGPLVKNARWRLYPQINIDAANGVSYNLETADIALEKSKDKIIVTYTNQILLLDSKYTYDMNTKMFESGERYPGLAPLNNWSVSKTAITESS